MQSVWMMGMAIVVLIAGGAKAREFTGSNGKKIEAEIVSKTGTEVELELEGGKVVTVPLSSLSDADQLWVSVWESPETKKARLKSIDPEKLLEAQGFIPLAVELKEGLMSVMVDVDGSKVRLLIDHRNDQPLMRKASIDRLELKMQAIEGGGQVLGTYSPEALGNGGETVAAVEFLVVKMEQLPEEYDGMIGGQVFVDWGATLDFGGKKLWVK